jgi:hypothetical protein
MLELCVILSCITIGSFNYLLVFFLACMKTKKKQKLEALFSCKEKKKSLTLLIITLPPSNQHY